MKIKPSAAAQVRISLHRKPQRTEEPAPEFLSTGSTLLDLALTDKAKGGFMKGKYFFLVGDSTSGKTFLSMTCLAEAARDPSFAKYKFVYDNVEDGMLMDVERLFGAEVAQRLRPPAGSVEDPTFSDTVEEFYYHIDDLVKKGKPFIYVLDSMDALTSKDEEAKFEETKEAHRNGGKVAGSYGDGKAKKNSSGLRKLQKGLRRTGSILIIIAQTRDALDAGPFGQKKTRSGGKSLKFYATSEMWTSVVETLKKTVAGKPRKIGVRVQIQTTKNRMTGKLHTITVPIFPSYGLDDIGSCIDYLVSEGWWKKKGGKIRAKELNASLPREKLVRLFEGDQKVKVLHRAVETCWKEIDAQCALQRRARYG